VRHLKGLQEIIPISVVKPYPKGDPESGWPGWRFAEDNVAYPGATVDPLFGSAYLHEIYFKANPHYNGRYSVPVLWDKKLGTIVNNESTELLRNLQTAFNADLPEDLAAITFYPEHLRLKIDDICAWMQRDLNVGVYKAGFAPDQATYDTNVVPVFGALNKLEKLLADSGGPFILGREMTEVDLRLYPTLVRFDTVYVQHFKCNLGTIRHDYPLLNNYLKNLYWNVKGCKETTDFRHIKENYTKSHGDINPKHITPRGPFPDVESYVAKDFGDLKAGGVLMPEVQEFERQI